MLILTCRVGESVLTGDAIEAHILSVKGNQVRIGIDAPQDIGILREELVGRDRDQVVEPAVED